MALHTILVANRGEIACRVIRTIRNLGLRSVAVHSEADRDAPHVVLADIAVEIGPGPAAESYLDPARVLAAAGATGADAVHPGYGFLSENAAFAEAVAAAGMVFIGPPPGAIRRMGNKAEAKRLMRKAGVPCVPGYEGADQSDARLAQAAEEIGYPVMVKAAAGGGGKGMRLVTKPEDLPGALALARAEGAGAFGSDQLILEQAIVAPRHVEVQIMADAHGNVIHLGERDCSVQRRHQKVVEEAPSPAVDAALRERMGQAAIAAAQSVGYRGAGTVEFLLGADGAFHFLEMNTRLQVEHPVTEMITGLDLVALQIAVADGAKLPFTQEEVRLDGHAIEVRLYAEDPANDFLPDIGRVALWRPAQGEGVRVDAGIAEGQVVPPHYDPMLAKLIAWGPTREVARARLVRAVEESVLFGLKSNSAFLADILARERFVAGEVTTAFLEQEFPDGVAAQPPDAEAVALAAAVLLTARRDAARQRAGQVPDGLLGWSSARPLPVPLTLSGEGGEWAVTATAEGADWRVESAAGRVAVEGLVRGGHEVTAVIDGQRVSALCHVEAVEAVHLALGAHRLRLTARGAAGAAEAGLGGQITAPMPGVVIRVDVEEGAEVAKGAVIAVLEAMKMQHQIAAPVSGRVTAVHVAQGDQLASGAVMIEIGEDP